MNNSQRNKLRMIDATHRVLEEIAGQMIAPPALLSARQLFNSKRNAIYQELDVQKVAAPGLADEKDRLRGILISQTTVLGGALYTAAFEMQNSLLLNKSTFTESDLKEMSGHDLQLTCQSLIELATQEDYSDYGVDNTLLTNLQNALDVFKAWVDQPRLGITERAGATRNLRKLLRETMNVLKYSVDRNMVAIANVSPRLYEQYLGARVIVDLRSHNLSADGDGNNTT